MLHNIVSGNAMGNAGKKSEPSKKAGENTKDKAKTPPPTVEDEDYEDGDFSTPKRDRYGNDDEPL